MELGYFCGCSAPDVDTARQAYDKVIILAPVYQVQVVVVFESWCIQHLVGNLRDLSSLGLGHNYRVLIEAAEGRSLWPIKVVVAGTASKNVLILKWIAILTEGLVVAELMWHLIRNELISSVEVDGDWLD